MQKTALIVVVLSAALSVTAEAKGKLTSAPSTVMGAIGMQGGSQGQKALVKSNRPTEKSKPATPIIRSGH